MLVAVATRRHDAGAVGPGLHPVLRGRQAARRRGPPLRAHRRHRRRRADRRHRLLRRRRLRRDPARPAASTINDASDAAGALEPLAGHLAATLFGLGFLGAALLAAAIVPLSTAYSVAEAFGRRGDSTTASRRRALFYLTYGAIVLLAAAIVLIPGAPLVPILFLSQALNAVLLLVILPFMRRLARTPR